jgi:lipopolysaccharide heptosyltransferase I
VKRKIASVGSPRILIVRTSALGDVVHALPVLTALRRHLPQAEIGWVVEEAMAPLLEGHPDLDRLLIVRLRRWRYRPWTRPHLRQMGSFLRRLGEFSPDIVLDLMGNHKAGAIGALTLADRRIGLARAHRREPSSALWISEPVDPEEQLGDARHAVDRGLALLTALGLPAEPADFGADRLLGGAPSVVDGRELAAAPPYLVVLPGAGWGNKRYPAAWWGRVAQTVGERTGIASWVAPGPGEEPLAREALAASAGWIRAVHAVRIRELAALLRHARLVVGGDTGPVHLAHALGTPVLCLMGPTDPLRSGPYGEPGRALWNELPCSFCNKRFDEPKACLLQVPPELVAERISSELSAAVETS